MFWRSQNVSATLAEFTLLKHKPINTGPVNVDYTQHLFNVARGPYVAFGMQRIQRALVFRVVRTGNTTLLSLIPRLSRLPSDDADDMEPFFEFVFGTSLQLGPKREIRFRFSQPPFIQSNIATLIIFHVFNSGDYNRITIDGRRKQTLTLTIINNVDEGSLEIKDNFVLSFDEEVPPRQENVAVDYFVAKRKLENFMLDHNIQENPQEEVFSHAFHDELLELYSKWFQTMLVFDSDNMPPQLRQVLRPSYPKEDAEIELKENTHTCAAYFMQQDTKYPLLVANAYVWRIAHWLSLRDV